VTNLARIRLGRTKVIPRRHDEDGASNFFSLSEDENGLWLMAAQGPGAGSAVPSS
jgi:hypothetical protein